MKNLLLLNIFLIFACSTQPAPQTEKLTDGIIQEPETTPEPLVAVNPSDVPDQTRERVVLVWIDSLAYDVFAALGYLQVLEKNGIRAQAFVGSGFGCWMSWSWALFGNGNRAEWQSMKWKSWDPIKKSFLARLGGRQQIKSFEQSLEEWIPLAKAPALPVDCPVLNFEDQRLFSNRRDTLSQKLWNQLQIPLYDKRDGDSATVLSAVWAGGPKADEFSKMSAALGFHPQDVRWIYIRTYDSKQLQSLESMDPVARLRKNHDRDAEFVETIELLPDASQNLESLKQPARRREFLLYGREAAKKNLQQ